MSARELPVRVSLPVKPRIVQLSTASAVKEFKLKKSMYCEGILRKLMSRSVNVKTLAVLLRFVNPAIKLNICPWKQPISTTGASHLHSQK
jgi:hypothetical protein